MFQFRRFPQYTYFKFQCIVPEYELRWVSSFRNLRINAYLQLPEAYRSLSRLSSAPSAKAFALRPCSLDHSNYSLYENGLYFLLILSYCQRRLLLPFLLKLQYFLKELTIIFVSQLLFSFQGTSWWCSSKPGLPKLWFSSHGGPKWTRTIDLTIISRVL